MSPYAQWNKTEGWVNESKPSTLFSDVGPGWMVCVEIDCKEFFIPLKFARKSDAEIAALSIRELIDWRGNMDDIAKRLKTYGLLNLKKRMTENLMW